MTKSSRASEPTRGASNKKASKNSAKPRPNHDSHQFVGARDFDPVLDVPNDETEERRELEPWLRVIEPPERGRPQISLRRAPDSGDFQALFVLELASVVATGFGATEQGHRTTAKIPPSDMVRNRYFRSLFSRLRTGQSIQFAHRGGRDESGDVVISSRIVGSSISPSLERAVETINTLFDNLMLALSADAANYRYVPSKALSEIEPSARLWRGSVRPLGLEVSIEQKRAIGFTAKAAPKTISNKALIAVPIGTGSAKAETVIASERADRRAILDSLIVAAAGCAAPFEAVLTIQPIRLTAAQIEIASEVQKLLFAQRADSFQYEPSEHSLGAIRDQTMRLLQADLECWLSRPQGYAVSCEVYSAAPIPEPFLEVLGGELFEGRPVVCNVSNPLIPPSPEITSPSPGLDLRNAINVTELAPPLFPPTEGLAEMGLSRHYRNPRVDLPDEGIVIGELTDTPRSVDVHFAEADRSRHCYMIGATGTGKSTLLYNLITQDIAAGRGVGLMDPHGDLYQEVLESVPRSRLKDVVVVDPTDFEHAVSINLLECNGPHLWKQRNFIINEIYLIFDRLYDLRVAGGPVFEQYLRASLALLMEDPRQDVTLADLPRVFEDRAYRDYLKHHCTDPLIRSFWTNTAERAKGDNELANMSAYITSKFNQFTHNRLIRPIIGQSKSTIDFRRIMDRGQILLVNLSKGLLGEKDTSFLGMLVMGKLLSATLSRADTETSRRRPFYLYVDEFQNFTTGTVTNMLAEARKYGLCLTLAHQNMRQLPVPLMDSVMGNVGTKLFFRIGTNDAPEIESYVKPNLSAQDLLSLPDHHVAGRLLAHNIPTPPFVFRTHPPQHRDAAAARSIGQDVVSHCRKHYTRPMSEVEQEISTRRQAYLDGEFALLEHVLRSSEIILSALGGMKVRTLGQLLATPKNDLIALLDTPAYLALEKMLAQRNLTLMEA